MSKKVHRMHRPTELERVTCRFCKRHMLLKYMERFMGNSDSHWQCACKSACDKCAGVEYYDAN
jgi:hypothetical protein